MLHAAVRTYQCLPKMVNRAQKAPMYLVERNVPVPYAMDPVFIAHQPDDWQPWTILADNARFISP